MANKVKYGLKNAYYAVITETGGTITYGTPVALPGAVSLSMAQQGEMSTFRADNTDYWKGSSNSGYEGDFEIALIPDSFRTDVLGEVLDAKGFYVERADAPTVEFAFLFQFEGDENAVRHCFYRCVATRPDVAGQTTDTSIEPQTETITISAMPRIADNVVKSRAPYEEETTSSYQKWFESVQEPTA